MNETFKSLKKTPIKYPQKNVNAFLVYYCDISKGMLL